MRLWVAKPIAIPDTPAVVRIGVIVKPKLASAIVMAVIHNKIEKTERQTLANVSTLFTFSRLFLCFLYRSAVVVISRRIKVFKAIVTNAIANTRPSDESSSVSNE